MLGISTSDARTITVVVIAIALLFVLVAVVRSRRDKTVRRTRWGFFIERDRYTDEESYRTNYGRQLPPVLPPGSEEITKEIKK